MDTTEWFLNNGNAILNGVIIAMCIGIIFISFLGGYYLSDSRNNERNPGMLVDGKMAYNIFRFEYKVNNNIGTAEANNAEFENVIQQTAKLYKDQNLSDAANSLGSCLSRYRGGDRSVCNDYQKALNDRIYYLMKSRYE